MATINNPKGELTAITPETAEAVPVAAQPGEAVALRRFAESFKFTVTDSFYSDAYLAINEPDSAHFRLGGGSQFSKFIAALEARRLAALATPSPQPADAVREVLEAVLSEVDEAERTNTRNARTDWRAREFFVKHGRAVRAALASVPAPAGEAVEPVAWGAWNGEFYETGPDEATMRYRHEPTRKVVPLYAHPAPEDTARLRADLERVTRELSTANDKLETMYSEHAAEKLRADTAERERDDARKALETAREDGRDWLFAEACKPKSEGGLGAFDNAVSWMKSKGCVLRAARSASRGGARPMSERRAQYPGIAAACQLIALDNGGINRNRSVKKQSGEMEKWLAKQPTEMVKPIDAWLSGLSEADLDEVCCGCSDDASYQELLKAAPPFTDALLNSYFDEVC